MVNLTLPPSKPRKHLPKHAIRGSELVLTTFPGGKSKPRMKKVQLHRAGDAVAHTMDEYKQILAEHRRATAHGERHQLPQWVLAKMPATERFEAVERMERWGAEDAAEEAAMYMEVDEPPRQRPPKVRLSFVPMSKMPFTKSSTSGLHSGISGITSHVPVGASPR